MKTDLNKTMRTYEKMLIESIAYSFEDDTAQEQRSRNWKLERAKNILLDLGPEYIPGESIELDAGRCEERKYFEDITELSHYVERRYELSKAAMNDPYEKIYDWSNYFWFMRDRKSRICSVKYILSESNKEYIMIKIESKNFLTICYCLTDNNFAYSIIWSANPYSNKIHHGKDNLKYVIVDLMELSEEDMEQIVRIIKAFNPKAIVK